MSVCIDVYIEIEKGSNIKYEFNKTTLALEVDRVLPAEYAYPHAYGFIPGTLAADGDDLDALIITTVPLERDKTYTCHIVDALRMEDEKGNDEKVICTLDGSDVSPAILTQIETFFATYKLNYPEKWSRTDGYMGKAAAIALYQSCVTS